MSVGSMVDQSLIIMVVGLTIVFLFLMILIFFVNFNQKIVAKFGWDKEPEPEKKKAPSGDNKAVVAAIGAAVSKYKESK